MRDRNENTITLEIPSLSKVEQRLKAIEVKLNELVSLINKQQINIKNMKPEKKMMTLNEVSETYGFSLWSLRSKAAKRELPLTKIGRRLYIDVADFEKWLSEKKIAVIR